MKRFVTGLAIAVVLIGCVLSLSLATSVRAASSSISYYAHTTATAPYHQARSGKSRVLGYMPKNKTLGVYRYDRGWYIVRWGNSRVYVNKKYIEKGKYVAPPNMYTKTNSEQIVNKMRSLKGNSQLVLVTASGYHKQSATIQTFAKDKTGKWKRYLIVQGIIGKNGLSHGTYEGSKTSPAGKYTMTQAFGRYGNPGTKLSYHRISADDVWVDNVHSKYYNTLQSMRKTGQRSERMNIPQYNYGFVINYNTKRVRGKGSAIFFHIAGGKYTLGCTATSKNNVITILKWLDPKKHPVMIQTVTGELKNY